MAFHHHRKVQRGGHSAEVDCHPAALRLARPALLLLPMLGHLTPVRVLAAGALLLAVTGACHAEASAEAAAGARIAAGGTPGGAAACAGCHGSKGEGGGAFPHLAGTGAGYLRAQLDAFAAGTRKNPIMQPIAQALRPEQRAQVAAYYSGLPKQSTGSDKPVKGPAETGAWLATRGRWADDLPACAQCHGPGGAGVGDSFPPLAGQPAAYIAQQLKAWREGSRPAGPLGLMQGVARKLADPEIQAVSDYYAGLLQAASDTKETK